MLPFKLVQQKPSIHCTCVQWKAALSRPYIGRLLKLNIFLILKKKNTLLVKTLFKKNCFILFLWDFSSLWLKANVDLIQLMRKWTFLKFKFLNAILLVYGQAFIPAVPVTALSSCRRTKSGLLSPSLWLVTCTWFPWIHTEPVLVNTAFCSVDVR